MATSPYKRVLLKLSGESLAGDQGYGIDPARGGLLTYDSIRRLEPDFLVHSGDLIYADNPLSAEQRLPDGLVQPLQGMAGRRLSDR